MHLDIKFTRQSLFFVITLALLTVGFLAYMVSGAKKVLPLPTQRELLKTNNTAATSTLISPDTDRDGLLDWEETLWKTDPTQADTDKDGTSDSQEVAERRDPTKPAPGDALSGIRKDTGTPTSLGAEPKTPPKPLSLPSEPVLPPAQPVLPVPTPVQTTNPLYVFGNALGKAIIEGGDNELDMAIWNKAVGKTKMTRDILNGFASLAQKYKSLAQTIDKIETPNTATEVRNNLHTAYEKYTDAIFTLSKTAEDAYLGATEMTAYSEATLALARAFVTISDLFYKERIGFSPSEPGNIFMFPR